MNNNLDTALIPGTEFEIRSTYGLKFGKPNYYIITKGLGLWHKSSSSWVSFDRNDKDIITPYDPIVDSPLSKDEGIQ